MNEAQLIVSERFRKNFKKFLSEKKMSQKEFCELTGYGISTLSNFLKGQTLIPRIDLIAAMLKVDPELNTNKLLMEDGVYELYKDLGQKESDLVESLRKTIDYLIDENQKLKKEQT